MLAGVVCLDLTWRISFVTNNRTEMFIFWDLPLRSSRRLETLFLDSLVHYGELPLLRIWTHNTLSFLVLSWLGSEPLLASTDH